MSTKIEVATLSWEGGETRLTGATKSAVTMMDQQ